MQSSGQLCSPHAPALMQQQTVNCPWKHWYWRISPLRSLWRKLYWVQPIVMGMNWQAHQQNDPGHLAQGASIIGVWNLFAVSYVLRTPVVSCTGSLGMIQHMTQKNCAKSEKGRFASKSEKRRADWYYKIPSTIKGALALLYKPKLWVGRELPPETRNLQELTNLSY